MPDSRTIADLVDVRPIVVVPVGSWEQHGPHLPFDTDTVIATEIARRAIERLHEVPTMLTSSIGFAASGEHSGFAGTISIGTETTARILVELVRSCDWSSGVVFVNGHGGNHEAIVEASTVIRTEGRRALVWSPAAADPTDSHAGRVETSVMLAVDPTRVRMDLADVGTTAPITDIITELRDRGVRAVSENGVLGDPTRANPDEGLVILDDWTSSLVQAVRTWLRDAT